MSMCGGGFRKNHHHRSHQWGQESNNSEFWKKRESREIELSGCSVELTKILRLSSCVGALSKQQKRAVDSSVSVSTFFNHSTAARMTMTMMISIANSLPILFFSIEIHSFFPVALRCCCCAPFFIYTSLLFFFRCQNIHIFLWVLCVGLFRSRI